MPSAFKGDDAVLNRWWTIAQFHEQPNKLIGETWADLVPRSPPVFLYIEERSGILGMGLSSDALRKHSWARLPRDEWLKVTMTMHWSQNADGETRIAVDGHPEFADVIPGPNMYNAYKHYLKLGQYRHPAITTGGDISYRALTITKL